VIGPKEVIASITGLANKAKLLTTRILFRDSFGKETGDEFVKF